MEQFQKSRPVAPVPGIPEPLVIGRRPMLGSIPGPLPTVRESPPDSVLDGAALPGLVVRAASVRGDAHRYYGTPRQDAMGLWQVNESQLLACVADGLSSKEMSHLGAIGACNAARNNLTDFFEHADVTTAAEHFVENIADDLNVRAAHGGFMVDALSTTFLAAVIDHSAETSRTRARVLRVGDSTAMLLHRGVWVPCFPEENGQEVSSSATHALPGGTRHVEVAVHDLEPGDMLLLCTDGLATPMTQNRQVGDQLSAWWSQPEPPSLPEFFWQFSFRAKSYDDDRTAICVWRV
ncbi:protein phosphatase 2C domain-containing protein [Streptosporangium sp. NPDC087985]|uniref:protein phosphatase 2C domain-containing protein n=1 Tax=Streptosporangium sp. NPDC087985 TaxID=3366196 RepID=UPI003822E812